MPKHVIVSYANESKFPVLSQVGYLDFIRDADLCNPFLLIEHYDSHSRRQLAWSTADSTQEGRGKVAAFVGTRAVQTDWKTYQKEPHLERAH